MATHQEMQETHKHPTPIPNVLLGTQYSAEKDKETQGMDAAILGPAVTKWSCGISHHFPSLGLDFLPEVLGWLNLKLS